MLKNSYNHIIINNFVNIMINNAVINVREKIAVNSLSKTSFKELLQKKQYHLILGSRCLNNTYTPYMYPNYFQHG